MISSKVSAGAIACGVFTEPFIWFGFDDCFSLGQQLTLKKVSPWKKRDQVGWQVHIPIRSPVGP